MLGLLEDIGVLFCATQVRGCAESDDRSRRPFAPPFGFGYDSARAVARVSPSAGMESIVGYIVALVIGTIIVASFLALSTGFLK